MAIPLLTLASRQNDRLKMIEAALKDKAPKTYQDLKMRGNLQAFLLDHEKLMMESYDQQAIAEREKILSTENKSKNPAQDLDMALHRTWETTIATWVEFSDLDEKTTTESSREV